MRVKDTRPPWHDRGAAGEAWTCFTIEERPPLDMLPVASAWRGGALEDVACCFGATEKALRVGPLLRHTEEARKCRPRRFGVLEGHPWTSYSRPHGESGTAEPCQLSSPVRPECACRSVRHYVGASGPSDSSRSGEQPRASEPMQPNDMEFSGERSESAATTCWTAALHRCESPVRLAGEDGTTRERRLT